MVKNYVAHMKKKCTNFLLILDANVGMYELVFCCSRPGAPCLGGAVDTKRSEAGNVRMHELYFFSFGQNAAFLISTQEFPRKVRKMCEQIQMYEN